ncbi:MAG: zinc ribbon domain-containing protein [Gammaproteobacteria bacterium]|nr:zinc ribbon domain-containing protein [Gammaproteobacteria bacterium]MCW5582309.1 zinc ribbon domain-containing protein [Gammaproteobacteria bacterium]
MPIYEYQCAACGHQLEVMQKMSDNPLKDCPECHQPALSKLVSAAGFQLKGSGWYKTDYSTKGKPKSDQNEKSGANDTGTESKSTDVKAKDTSPAASTTSSSNSGEGS